jgi:PIN domain nuclease of toxin-antitoxin system
MLWNTATQAKRIYISFWVWIPRRSLLDNDCCELPILREHAVAIDALPPIHIDPFDRMLVAQATV